MTELGEQFELFGDKRLLDIDLSDSEGRFSDYVVYVDESGDHSLVSIDKDYPAFVLALCVFHKRHYAEQIVPAVEKLKFNYFGHDSVVLHENEIRKQKGDFRLLTQKSLREKFVADLDRIMNTVNFILIGCVIDKLRCKPPFERPSADLYHIAMRICLDALYDFMEEKGQQARLTHVMVERRGAKEDADLELAFRRICDGNNQHAAELPFSLVMASKQVNSVGLQLADLVARPIGIHHLRPEQPNRAFTTLERKFFCEGGRAHVGEHFDGVGLKIFPPPDSERPR